MDATRVRKILHLHFALLGLGLALSLICVPRSCEAQVLYGSMLGNVTDPSGAAIPGATISVTQKQTGFTRTALTDQSGGYDLPTIPTGNYDVQVSKSGFKAFTRSDVPVQLNTVARVDVTLEVGAISQTVEVKASAPLLQTDRADVHAEITTNTLENVPLPPGRNYQQLFRTVPGFMPLENAHSIPSNPSRSLRYRVNGTSASSNDVRVDGAGQYNVWLPHVTAYVPALEAIQTVNVVTNNFDIQQGLAGGSTVNVQIKSGTNQIHGSAFEYHTDNGLEARSYFVPGRAPKDIFNQFGGTVGGPIKKDKIFYFASYEGTLNSQFSNRFGTVPTKPMRTGDLSDSDQIIYDPATGNPDGTGRQQISCNGVKNVICPGRISPIAQKLLDLLPQPNLVTTSLDRNFLAGASFKFNRHTVDSKVDWHATDKFNMYGRFSYLHYSDTDPEMFGKLGGPEISGFGGNPGQGFGYSASTTIAGTYVVRPNFIVDSNFGYTVMDTSSAQSRLDEKLGLDFLGLPGTNGPRSFEGGWPRFQIDGFTTLGIAHDFMPYFRHDPQFHYNANAAWIKGPHNIRFGVDFAHQGLNHTQAEFAGAFHGAQGGFRFSNGVTTLNTGGKKASKSSKFNSFAAFLLGLPSNRGRNFQVPDQFTTRTNLFGAYIGDQWQVNRKLTLTFGTRYELFPIPGRADRGLERYDLATNKMLVCGIGQVPHDCGVDYTKLRIAPRFGFAYRATNSFVIRGGYGITNDPYDLGRSLRTNYPTLVPFNDQDPSAFSSFLPVGPLSAGIPLIPKPDLGNGVIDINGKFAVNILPPHFTRGYIQSWNFMLEKQVKGSWVAQAGYVATRSTNQLGFLDVNVGTIGGGDASRPLNKLFGRTARTGLVQPVGNTHYDSLQTSLKHRFSGGYQVEFAYTFSKTTGIAGVSDSDNSPSIQLPQFYYLNRGLSTLDVPHNFESLFIAELPFGKGKRWASNGGVVSALAGGWQINGIFSRFSGRVFSVGSSGTSLSAPGNSQRADLIKPQVAILGGHGTGQSYFDPFAFAEVTDPRFGTAGFNILRGPGAANLDLGLFREFRISERWNLQFRAEAINFTNTPHFGNPGTNVSDIQLDSLGNIKNLNGYTEIKDTRSLAREGVDQRVIRFGLRLSF